MSSFDKTSQATITIFFPNGETKIYEADNAYTLETEEELYGEGNMPKLDFVDIGSGKRIQTSGVPYLIESNVAEEE